MLLSFSGSSIIFDTLIEQQGTVDSGLRGAPPGDHAVLEDYTAQLNYGIAASSDVITNSLGVLISNQTNFEKTPFFSLDESLGSLLFCNTLLADVLTPMILVTSMLIEGQEVAVLLYNSLGWTQNRIVEVQLGSLGFNNVIVSNAEGKTVDSERLFYGDEQESNSTLFFVSQVHLLNSIIM